PLEAVESIKGKDITLVLNMGDGIKWTVNGKDLTGISKDIDLEVSLGVTSVPVSVINNLTGERKSVNFTLPADIGPGFRAVLTLPIGKEWEGAYANLFYYDRRQEKMEFISFCRIGEDGCAELEFGAGSGTGAADLTAALEEETDNCYTVVIDDHPLTPETEEEPANEPEQTGKPAVKLKGVSADGKITLSWNRVKGAEKYRVYQRVGGKYRLLKEYKSKRSLTLKKTLTAGKGKKALKVGKKYTFAVRAYVDGKWTKIGKDSKVTVKAEE
ncbi:MAG: hypothetical protein ILP10_03295, partial [Lachnospiraceae bacterium]|nr:hypothetical protein [Lachnospiraceae bacterium]